MEKKMLPTGANSSSDVSADVLSDEGVLWNPKTPVSTTKWPSPKVSAPFNAHKLQIKMRLYYSRLSESVSSGSEWLQGRHCPVRTPTLKPSTRFFLSSRSLFPQQEIRQLSITGVAMVSRWPLSGPRLQSGRLFQVRMMSLITNVSEVRSLFCLWVQCCIINVVCVSSFVATTLWVECVSASVVHFLFISYSIIIINNLQVALLTLLITFFMLLLVKNT